MVTGTQTAKHIQMPEHHDNTIENVVSYLKEYMPHMPENRLREIATHVYLESKERDLDYRLVLAVMKVESNFKQDAVSSKGARGLLQIKPSLGRGIAETLGITWSGNRILHEPGKNIKFGVYHLSQLIDDFENLQWALYAYNSGSTKARERSAQHKEPEPRFAKAVLSEYEKTMTVLPEAQ
jgi:soluble lytic murein transglycosylase